MTLRRLVHSYSRKKTPIFILAIVSGISVLTIFSSAVTPPSRWTTADRDWRAGRLGPSSPGIRPTIVYSCNKLTICGGWADRQKGIVSGYVLAVLMGRVFRLDIPRPCNVSIFLQPNEFLKGVMWRHGFYQRLHTPALRVDLIKVDWILRPGEAERGTRSDVEGIDSHGDDLLTEMLARNDLNVPQLQADYVFLTWNMEMVHKLRRHRLARTVSWLSPEKSVAEIYLHVLHKLFRPSASLASLLAGMQLSRSHSTQLACAQIRLGSSPHFKDSEVFNTLQAVSKVVDFLKPYNQSSRYRIFFAADNVETLKLAKERFPETFVETKGPVTHVDKYVGPDACMGFGRAILDQMILSTCDVLVISESGLGKIAAFLRNSDKDLYLFHDSQISVFRRDLAFPNRQYW